MNQQIQASLIVESANDFIKEFWGKKGTEQAKAQFIKNKVLTIMASNASMAQEIKFKQNRFMDSVNEKYKDRVVTRLTILISNIDKNDEII